MDIMNYEKALNTLGLKRNYTEEDLKKAYRRLIVKYHPDKWAGKSKTEKKKAEEKAKEINAAKDFLEKYKGKGTHTYTNNNNKYYSETTYTYAFFVQAQANFIQELNNYDRELTVLIPSKEIILLELLQKIKILQKINNEYRYRIISTKNINDLNRLIISYKAEIWKQLEIFTIEYCEKYNINTNTSKLEKYSLKKLYEQLENLRRQQNTIEIKLNQKQEKYILYAGYNIIKENIEKIKIKIIREYYEGLTTEERAVNSFEKKILEEFKEYYRRLKEISELEKLGYTDKYVIDIIQLMKNKITAEKSTFNMLKKNVIDYIAEKESNKTSKKSIKTFNIFKEKPKYNSNKTIKKDYYIKHNESEKPKYKIKKNR